MGEKRSEREARTQLVSYQTTEHYTTYQQYVQRFRMGGNSQSSIQDRPVLQQTRAHNQGVARNSEMKKVLLRLANLASLNGHESSTTQRLVETSPGRRDVTAQAQQRQLLRERAHDANSAITAHVSTSEEIGFDETLTLESLSIQLAEHSLSLQRPHDHIINPFLLQSHDVTRSFLLVFLDRVNPILCLFDERTLFRNLELAYGGEVNLSSQVMCELCLALAVGAQCCDHGSTAASLLWYENGRRFLDDNTWDNKPWVMRAVTLVSIYYLSTRRETARQYLHIGIRIAAANDFFDSALSRTDQMFNHEWLVVWNTIMVIDGWLSISPVYQPLSEFGRQMSMDVLTQSASAINTFPFRYFCELFTTLRSLKRSITTELASGRLISSTTTERWLEELEKWRRGVPAQCFHVHPDSDRRTGSPERKSSVNLHMVSMYLGIKMRLSYPVLIEVLDWYAINPSPPLEPDEAAIRVTGVCIKSAAEYASFCEQTFSQGFFCADSSFPVQLLLDSALIGMIARVLYTRGLRAGTFSLLYALNIAKMEWTTIFDKVRKVLSYRSAQNQWALAELYYINSLEQAHL